MTESFDWDDTPQDNTPKGLRTAYESMKAHNAEMKKQLEDLAREVRGAKIHNAFSRKGLPEKAADLFPKDVDPTPEAVDNWISSYGGLFNPSNTAPQTEQPKQDPNPIQAPLEQMGNIAASGTPSGNSVKEEFARILDNPNATFEEFKAGLEKMQGVM